MLIIILGPHRAYPVDADSLVTVKAEATVPGQGLEARNAAIAQAQVGALHTHLQSIIGKDRMHLVGRILNQADAYVQTFRLVHLDQSDDMVRVEVVFYIQPDVLRADLADLMLPLLPDPPAVVVLIGEQSGSVIRLSGTDVSIAELSFAQAFHNEGFDTLDPYILRERYTQPQLMSVLREGNATAARMARQNQVDVILMGAAQFSEVRTGTAGGTWRVTATLNLRLINAESGKEVRALSASASLHSASIQEARRQAVIDAGGKIVDEAFVNTVLAVVSNKNPDTVWLAIEGPGNRLRTQEILASLKRLQGLTALEEMYHSPNVARFRCQYEGSMKDFVSHLTEDAHYSDFSLDSRVVSGQEATLTLTPARSPLLTP